MNPIIRSLCADLGIPTSDRNLADSWVWDGQTLATRKNRHELIEGSDDDFVSHLTDLMDHEILHEIGHWLACSDPDQRLFPEFGLRCRFAFPDAMGGQYPDIKDLAFWDGLIPGHEQDIQEHLAQFIAVYLGKQLGCSSALPDSKGHWETWDEYLQFKDAEAQEYGFIEVRETARERFRDLMIRAAMGAARGFE